MNTSSISHSHRSVPTRDLPALIEERRWQLAELLAAPNDDPEIQAGSVAFIEVLLADAVDEWQRRERLRDHPTAPPWPTRFTPAIDAQAVKDRVSILSYLRDWYGIVPTQQGRNYVTRCLLPSHPGEDTHPSLRITASGRGWHCYPCGVGGDLIALACAYEGWTFREAVAKLGGKP